MKVILRIFGVVFLLVSIAFIIAGFIPGAGKMPLDLILIFMAAGTFSLILGFMKSLTGDHANTLGWILAFCEIVVAYLAGFFLCMGIGRLIKPDFVYFIKPSFTGMTSIIYGVIMSVIIAIMWCVRTNYIEVEDEE